MNTLTDIAFQILLKNATVNQFCSAEYILYNDSNDEFFFYIDTKKGKITDKGELQLTGDQYDSIVDMAVKQSQEDNPETEPFNHMEEYGLNNQMFI